jgi:hypothetical protein
MWYLHKGIVYDSFSHRLLRPLSIVDPSQSYQRTQNLNSCSLGTITEIPFCIGLIIWSDFAQ